MPVTSKSLKSAADYRKALITDLLTTQRVPKKFSWYEGFSWSTGKKAPVLVIGSLAKPLKAALQTGGAELKATGRCMLRGDSLCFETGSGSLSNTKLQAFLTAHQSGLAAENADFGAAEAGYEADDERSGSSSDSEEEDDWDEPSVPDEPPPDALQEEQERAAARQAEEERLRAEEEARQAEAERLRLEEEARLTAAAQAEAKERQPEVKKRVVRLRENATEAQKMVLLDIQTGLGEAWNGRQWRLVVERMNAADRTLDEIEAEIRTFLMAQAEAVDQFSKLCAAWAALKTAYTDEVLASLQQTWARQEDRSFAAHQELLAESSAQHRDFLSGRDKLKEQFGEISVRRKALLLAANGEQKARLTEAYDAMMSRAKAGYLDDAFARLEDFRRLMEEVEDELEQERQLVVDNLQELVEAAERTLESLDGGLIGMERDELAERLGLAREAAEQGKKATCEQALAALQEQLDRATGQQALAEELMVRRSTYPARVEAAEEHAEGHTGLVAAIHRVWENAPETPPA